MMKLTDAQIEAAKSPRGAWTKKTLAAWGVPWPPPKGWRRALISGRPIPEHRRRRSRSNDRRSDRMQEKADSLAFKIALICG
jgi:hypothetical protein